MSAGNRADDRLAILTDAPVDCSGCGECCRGIGSPIVVYARGFRGRTVQPPATMPAELIAEIDDQFSGLHRGQEPQAQCFWFDKASRRCRHYEYRPPLCREYELGGVGCLLARQQAIQGLQRCDADGPE